MEKSEMFFFVTNYIYHIEMFLLKFNRFIEQDLVLWNCLLCIMEFLKKYINILNT